MRRPRFRFRALLPWLVLLVALATVCFIVWFAVIRGGPSALQVLAWDPDGLTGNVARLEVAPTDPLGPGTPRVPLLLALRNSGPTALQARSLALSLPSWLRLETDDGTPLPAEVDGGNPLMRYRLALDPVRVPGGSGPVLLPGVGRIWMRPFASAWRCTLDDDGLPAFLPAPPLDPRRLARGTVFWSVEEAGSGRRATGTLDVVLDPALFETGSVAAPPDYPSRVLPADSPRPDLASLVRGGTRTVACGGMIEPVTLTSTVYSTPTGGLILAVAVDDGMERLLFDLDGNDTIEAEAWAADGAPAVNRVRRARYAIPDFLLPLPPPPEPTPPDTMSVDSLAQPADTLAPDTVRSDIPRSDTAAAPDTAVAR